MCVFVAVYPTSTLEQTWACSSLSLAANKHQDSPATLVPCTMIGEERVLLWFLCILYRCVCKVSFGGGGGGGGHKIPRG